MTGHISECQSCGSRDLESVLWLGYHPHCNAFVPIGAAPTVQKSYPLELFHCQRCELVQLGFIAPQEETFPASYPYRSSVTRVLRENFTDLYNETTRLLPLAPHDLIIDIGGNDGNLLSNFTAHRTLNVTPEDIGKLGEERGIPHLQRYWSKEAAAEVLARQGKARVVTATNVFAHVPNVHDFIGGVLDVLTDDGLFVTESHYLGAMLQGVQFDAVYPEHHRVYSLKSLRNLLEPHGLTVFHAHTIPTHGGSFRAFAARKPPGPYGTLFEDYGAWANACSPERIRSFATSVAEAKRRMWETLAPFGRVVGIGAPSRAATLVNYVGVDHSLMPYICETPGSHKIGCYMPGTRIEVVDEARLYEDQPSAVALLSWHIGSELMPKIREKGYRGKFVSPLPKAEVFS